MTASLAQAWSTLQAPVTGDVRAELVLEAAEFLGLSPHDARARLQGAGERFREEWLTTVRDRTDAAAVTAFYNQTDTELFELIEWHAVDPIHYRSLIVRDFVASEGQARTCLDYGSGIGSDALVFATAGLSVTLADISDVLREFAAFRCRRRGLTVQTIDLKREELPHGRFDLAICLDVLEHVPKPLDAVRAIRRSLREHGLLVVHAPFGEDAEHPMHVVHEDVVTPRMRSLGLAPVDCAFPTDVRAPLIYRKTAMSGVDRFAYYLYDGYLRGGSVGPALAAVYRHVRKGARRDRRTPSTHLSDAGA
jgi:SAM-dependent methyltransferase